MQARGIGKSYTFVHELWACELLDFTSRYPGFSTSSDWSASKFTFPELNKRPHLPDCTLGSILRVGRVENPGDTHM